eukprot:8563625-Prorocentrum_lima.AAC.1
MGRGMAASEEQGGAQARATPEVATAGLGPGASPQLCRRLQRVGRRRQSGIAATAALPTTKAAGRADGAGRMDGARRAMARTRRPRHGSRRI